MDAMKLDRPRVATSKRNSLPWLAGFVGLALLASGCAGALGEGQTALRKGDYPAATRRFEDVLSEHPDQVAARFGLGVALYRLGDLERARKAFERVVAASPRSREAQLYLGITSLKQGDQTRAEQEFRAFRALGPPPRAAALTERAIALIVSGPLSLEVRDFIAASLEDQLEWEREVREARLTPRAYLDPTWAFSGDRFGGYPWGWSWYVPVIPHAP